jgi:hypothetical protein
MRKIFSVFFVLVLNIASLTVRAQTCSATAGNSVLTGANSAGSLVVDTCVASDQLAVACSGLSPIGNSPDMVWQMTLGPGASNGVIVFTPSGTAWNPYLILMAGACSGGSTCLIDADNAGSGTGVGAAESGQIPANSGTYWLMITDESGLTTCGTGNLMFGNLPISLQSFSIE